MADYRNPKGPTTKGGMGTWIGAAIAAVVILALIWWWWGAGEEVEVEPAAPAAEGTVTEEPATEEPTTEEPAAPAQQ